MSRTAQSEANAYFVSPDASLPTQVRSEPFGQNVAPIVNFNALGASMILAVLTEFSEENRIQRRKNRLEQEREKRRSNGSKQVKFTDYDAVIVASGPSIHNITYGVWIRSLDYLLCENTLPFVPENDKAALINSRFVIPSSFSAHPNRIAALESALQTCPVLSTNHFFSQPYRKDFEYFPMLLDVALNADLAIVKAILENATAEQCKKLLSAEHGTGKATTYLGRAIVERTGTPLQMAIYDHDEEMVALFKEKMDPAEFQCQCEAVVGTDYNAFLKSQEKEAIALCAELEDAFKAVPSNEFTVDNNHVASTASKQLPGTIDAFINQLMDYVKNNPVHNPYILLRVYEIYRCLSDFNCDCFFSQKVIGGVQSFLSARWLQHYARGIDFLVAHNEVPRRSFICCNSNIDVRHLGATCIGLDSLLSRARICMDGLAARAAWHRDNNVAKLMSNKHSKLKDAFTFTPRVQPSSCVVQ